MSKIFLDNLSIEKYRFRFTAKSTISLPPYKGSTFHGGFGHSLKKISPTYYDLMFTSGDAGDHPKPFVLVPPLDPDKTYKPGDPFECELTLFGSAIQYFPICHAALEYLGNQLGIGENRGRYIVDGVDRAQPSDTVSSHTDCITGTYIAKTRGLPVTDALTINFPTRLRLKENGRVIQQPPSFKILVSRLLGRLDSLAHFYGKGRLMDKGFRRELIQEAEKVTLVKDNLAWENWRRYSGRQKTWMKFGGFSGRAAYKGALSPFMPFLAMGEWTHVGNKTSFGLGKYIMET